MRAGFRIGTVAAIRVYIHLKVYLLALQDALKPYVIRLAFLLEPLELFLALSNMLVHGSVDLFAL